MKRRDILKRLPPVVALGSFGCLDRNGQPPEEGRDDDADGVFEPRVTASTEAVELPWSEFTVTVENVGDSRETVHLNRMNLWKLVDGEPVYVQPVSRFLELAPYAELEPGESHVWEVEVDNEADDLTDDSGDSMLYTGLGSGTYVWGLSESEDFEDGFFRPGDEDRTAEVEITGEDPEITPVYVDEVADEGEEVRVKLSDGDRGDEEPSVSVRSGAEQEAPEDTPELIPEQVMQFATLRNIVHYMDEYDHGEMVIHGGPVREPGFGPAVELPRYPYFGTPERHRFLFYFTFGDETYEVEFDEQE